MRSSLGRDILEDKQGDNLYDKLGDMKRVAKAGRAKLSTTIDSRNFAYLQSKVAAGEAASVAEVLDRLLRKIRKIENRERLAAATTDYFDNMDSREVADEGALARNLSSAASRIDFDEEL